MGIEHRDVVVLGGGPAGSTFAAILKKYEPRVSVTLLEKARFPRYHIGESTIPAANPVLRDLEIYDEMGRQGFVRKMGITFVWGQDRTPWDADYLKLGEVRLPESGTQVINVLGQDFSRLLRRHAERDETFNAFNVRRADFDHLLLKHAQKLGAEVREEWEAIDVIFEGPRAIGVRARDLRAPSNVVELFAPVIADATGRDTLLASRTRKKATIARLDKTALFTHYRGTFRQEGLAEGNIQIVIFDHGWFWFIPFRGDVTSVGIVVSSEWIKQKQKGETLDAFYDRTAANSCWAKEFLASAERLRPVGALADFSYRVDQLAGDGWLFVGDAGGFLDPLFSTGAHLAIKGGALAAKAIDEALTRGDVSRAAFTSYEKNIRYAVDLFLGVVQGFYAGHFRETLFEPNQRAVMRKLITSMLSGDVFHQDHIPKWASFLRERYPAEVPAFA